MEEEERVCVGKKGRGDTKGLIEGGRQSELSFSMILAMSCFLLLSFIAVQPLTLLNLVFQLNRVRSQLQAVQPRSLSHCI